MDWAAIGGSDAVVLSIDDVWIKSAAIGAGGIDGSTSASGSSCGSRQDNNSAEVMSWPTSGADDRVFFFAMFGVEGVRVLTRFTGMGRGVAGAFFGGSLMGCLGLANSANRSDVITMQV